MWDQDLTQIEGLEAKVTENLKKIHTEGAKAAYASLPVIAGKCVKTAESSAAESRKWASAAFFS